MTKADAKAHADKVRRDHEFSRRMLEPIYAAIREAEPARKQRIAECERVVAHRRQILKEERRIQDVIRHASQRHHVR